MARKGKDSEQARLLDQARDELFSHIHRCGVLRATEEQQVEWVVDTIDFLSERYPDLSDEQLDELRMIGIRFCQPAVPYGSEPSETDQDAQGADDAAATGVAA